ncbi:hypothetical protein [Puniceibacterium confluentis]|uniref:hypothetical protein n=1 Tax=Puniceibacterium confluentis TaxID=1958944 RepID=UPI0011B37CDC|nr:hypothetical protein [Puniceibacterium confluentis]
MNRAVLFASLVLIAGCTGTGTPEGIDRVRAADGSLIVRDTVGASLVVDPNGCQTVVPADGGPPQKVLGADGAPACLNEQ